jgi:hypothetical protein
MTTNTRRDTRRNTQLTEIWVLGTAEETTALLQAMRASGRFHSASPLESAGPGDPRYRLYIRLRTK